MPIRKALLIGIDQYSGENALNGCVQDAYSLKPLLEFNEDGSRNFDVITHCNVRTKKEAMKAIKELFSGDGDMALFYFSGHGWVNDTDAELAFPDAVDHADYYLGLKMSDVLSIAQNSKYKNKVIILDCCHSGAMGRFNLSTSEAVIGEGMTILCACRDTEPSWISNGKSLFTEQLVYALSGEAADFMGNVTMGRIYVYVDHSFGPSQQRPTFKTNVTAFAPIRKVTPKVGLKTLRALPILFSSFDQEYNLDPSFEYTNTSEKLDSIPPYANENNVAVFKTLQELESIGLVEPIGERHMYYAAMHSKSCALSKKGIYYWRLAKEGLIK